MHQEVAAAGLVVVLDVDGVLAESWQGADDRYGSWIECILDEGPRPLAEVQRILQRALSVDMAVSTSRREMLRAPTASWLAVHFPALLTVPLLMRRDDDRRSSWQVRRDHVAEVRAGRRVLLVDDDVMADFAIDDGDVLFAGLSDDVAKEIARWPRR